MALSILLAEKTLAVVCVPEAGNGGWNVCTVLVQPFSHSLLTGHFWGQIYDILEQRPIRKRPKWVTYSYRRPAR